MTKLQMCTQRTFATHLIPVASNKYRPVRLNRRCLPIGGSEGVRRRWPVVEERS